MSQIYGYIAAFLSTLALIPLLINTTIQKSTDSLRYEWLIIKIVAGIMWFYYGITNNLIPNIISSLAVLSFLIYLTGIKYYYEYRGIAKHQTKCK